jgi:hypothetical protein
MVRSRKKKALYEVIGKAASRSGYDRKLEPLHPEEPGKETTAGADSVTRPTGIAMWPRRPRTLQFTAGRIEISVPYQIAVALLLGVVLVLLIVFRIGEGYARRQAAGKQAALVAETVQPEPPDAIVGTPQPPVAADQQAKPAEPVGNNRIVIQTYQLRAHLAPVQEYFARFGIETQIARIGDWYYLMTVEKYDNPDRPGTDGYVAKQRIIELGAEYKAPTGFESFAPNLFKDAYGMRFDE